MVSLGSLVVFVVCCLFGTCCSGYSVNPRGCAATPAQKKNVALLGGGGYLGAITFGFLQRAGSLFGTGIGKVRCIGASADTATRLNRILVKNFCLAFADESVIKLTDLQSVSSIANRLENYDALILGTDLKMQTRAVSPGTYEKTPNDKAWEVYWDEPKGSFAGFDFPVDVKNQIVENTLKAAKAANIQHLLVVDDGSILPILQNTGIPYTCILQPSQLFDTPNWTFQKGICDNLSIETVTSTDNSNRSESSVSREDLAALFVQVLQSLPWETSRTLSVSSNRDDSPLSSTSSKRVDQQWCVNSICLDEKLASIK